MATPDLPSVLAPETGLDYERATKEYACQEHLFSNDPRIDFVLVGSDSIETVKVTHANYFEGGSKRLIEEAFNLL